MTTLPHCAMTLGVDLSAFWTYLSSKATLFCKWKWKCLSCPSHTFSALTVRFNNLVLWNNGIAVLLPSAVDKVKRVVYSTIVKCDSAPCLYVSNYVYKLWIRVIANPADNTIPCQIFHMLPSGAFIREAPAPQFTCLAVHHTHDTYKCTVFWVFLI